MRVKYFPTFSSTRFSEFTIPSNNLRQVILSLVTTKVIILYFDCFALFLLSEGSDSGYFFGVFKSMLTI